MLFTNCRSTLEMKTERLIPASKLTERPVGRKNFPDLLSVPRLFLELTLL